MSLFKAYTFPVYPKSTQLMIEDFMSVIDSISTTEDSATKEEAAYLLFYYTEYATAYLNKAATELSEERDSNKTMQFMNSYIAEAFNLAGLKYYNKDMRFSIVDKTVELFLIKGGDVSIDEIIQLIDSIQESYKTDEVDEEV